MSAIKISGLNIFFPVFLLLIFSCSKPSEKTGKSKGEETFEYIILSEVGGMGGHYKNIKVTQDSVILTTGNTMTNRNQTWNKALSTKDKTELFGQLKINQLAFIKSSESLQAADGVDETFQVKTSRTSYVFVNAYNDGYNYRQLANFKAKLAKIIPEKYR
ncbi:MULTISPECIES: hypothetical protein [unclassified Chryseobacterium]|uniref:hypothetical protein n=1 Tax=unclassified Chryseobacterium TaxID=2593645 RepID=UPI000B09BE94|nr:MULTISPECIES: hypothetical protein [unclassified Chryseobacterium]